MLRKGSRGTDVRDLQEWLNLHDFGCGIDGDFGPATEAAVTAFQLNMNQPPVQFGEVDASTWQLLHRPIERATAIDRAAAVGMTLPEAIVYFAKQHLAQHPREVGGQNRGPWVRLYCSGRDGDVWAWCAGFVSYIIGQACEATGATRPIRSTVSCDVLALAAEQQGQLVRYASASRSTRRLPQPRAGDLFLVYRRDDDWAHTGIVTDATPSVVVTIEGNTNDEGSREGYEVCARRRSYSRLDFISLQP